jgi:hypothetical protein
MPAFIGKNSTAWRENIAGDSGGIKLAGDGGRKDWREGVAGTVVARAGRKPSGVNAKRQEKSSAEIVSGSRNPNYCNRVQLTRIYEIGVGCPDFILPFYLFFVDALDHVKSGSSTPISCNRASLP